MHKKSGFSLIEVLVVIGIIGLLATIVTVATGTARTKARDARRLDDIQQVKTGLDLYYNTGGGYPATDAWNTAQAASAVMACSGTDTLRVPQDPIHATNSSFAYTYTQGGDSSSGCGGNVYTDYKIQFQTEARTSIGAAGTYYLSSKGISSTAPF